MDPEAPYDPLARIYDERWRFFTRRGLPVLDRLLLHEMETGSTLLDVCCGTGELARLLVERGLRVVGVDQSSEMLSVAREKVPHAVFVHADARDFTLPAEHDAAVSAFDSLNHILSLDELERVFRNVHGALRPGGRFVFDLNLRDGFRDRWKGQSAEVTDHHALLTRSRFDEETALARMELTLFEAGPEGCWSRRDVVLEQRCHEADEVLAGLRRAGFADVDVEVQPADSRLSGRGYFQAVRREGPAR